MVDRYIKELLIESNRVIVPDFGAFIARTKSDSTEKSLEHKTIVFNDILKFNDGLLVNYIIKAEDSDLAAALQKISDFIQTATKEFDNGNDYLLEGIGHLHRDKRGNITLIVIAETQITSNENTPVNTPAEIENKATEKETEGEAEKEIVIQNDFSPVSEVIPPPIPVVEEATVPPPVPQAEKEEMPIEIKDAEEAPVVVSDQKENETIAPQFIPEKQEEKIVSSSQESENIPVVSPVENTESTDEKNNNKEISKEEEKPVVAAVEKTKPEPVKKEEKKIEKKTPEVKTKPIKKEIKPQGEKKKSPKWLSITIWSVSGLLFLSLVFMAAVKFGFIKGVNLFSKDQWITVNEKLHKDLEDYNKKHKDNLKLPEVNKDDNNKGAFSGTESGSAGSFDAPSNDAASTENTSTSASSSEGSFGSFDEPAKEEKKETKTTETKKESKSTNENTQFSSGENSMGATGKYILVAGSFKSKSSAEIFIEQLKKKGFDNAEYVGIKNGSHMVCYGSYDDQKEANAEYQKLQQKAVQTWILKQ